MFISKSLMRSFLVADGLLKLKLATLVGEAERFI